MANTYNENARLISLTVADIFTFTNNTDANSGFRPMWVRKVVLRPAAASNEVIFKTLQTNSTPTLAVSEDTYTVTSTYRITDVSSGGVFNGATAGDWAHIRHSSSGNNKGWFYISAVDGSKHYIDVAYADRALTNEASKNYIIDIYTPETAMTLVAAGTEVMSEELDWGSKGRYFHNLGLHSITAGTVDIYLA